MVANISGFTVMDLANSIHKFDIYASNINQSNTRGLSAWQLRCLIVYATLMMSNCLWYTAKLIFNDLDLIF